MGIRVGYARVSTREQEENSHALDQQCRQLEVAGCEKIYREVGSRSNPNRGEFLKLLRDCRNGGIDEVVVVRIDRFTGHVPTLLNASDELAACGVALLSLYENIDARTSSGEFMLTVHGALARVEVQRMRERVKDGFRDLRSQGRASGSTPFGYFRVDDQLKADLRPWVCRLTDRPTGSDELFEGRSRWQVAREVVGAFFEGGSLGKALRLLSQWYGFRTFRGIRGRRNNDWPPLTKSGLATYFRNPILRGHVAYRRDENGKKLPHDTWWIVIRDRWPALLSEMEYQEIVRTLGFLRRHKRWGGTKVYSLSGLVACEECRHVLRINVSGTGRKTDGSYREKVNYYFQCPEAAMKLCGNRKLIRLDAVEEVVIAGLNDRATKLTRELTSGLAEQQEPIALQELRRQLRGLSELGENPALEQARRELRRQIDALCLSYDSDSLVDTQLAEELIAAFSDPDFVRTLPLEAKRHLFLRFVDTVLVRSGRVVSIAYRV
jgi:DNA invertase Pin-like site-specific DNA recombinase